MEMFAYDIEVFRNYALFVFVDVSEYFKIRKSTATDDVHVDVFKTEIFKAKRFIFRIGLGVNEISNLVSFVNRDIILASFNGLDYDNIIVNACISNVNYWRGADYINQQLYNLSKRIISNQDAKIYNDDKVTIFKYMRTFYKTIDVQKVFGLNKILKSLKQTLINLKWYNIEDYEMPAPIPEEIALYTNVWERDMLEVGELSEWDRFIMKEYERGVFWYCNNDTLGVCEILFQKAKDIILRFKVSNQYDVEVLSSSESNMADRLFAKFYCDVAEIPYADYKKGRTYRSYIAIDDCIPTDIKFYTPELNAMLVKLRTSVIVNTKGDLNFSVDFRGTTYTLKTGGLHSKDKPAKFEHTDDTYLIDADVTSYYPMVVNNNMIAPEHLNTHMFVNTTSTIVRDRIRAKKAKDKTRADTLKIVINSGIFGKMGFEDSPAYDPKAMVSVTIGGQLYLLMLIERVESIGCSVVSANTDGIVAIVPKDKVTDYYKQCNIWCEDTKLELEYTFYSKYIRRDVNNYMSVKIGETLEEVTNVDNPVKKSVKYKGSLNPNLYKEDLRKGFKNPIVAKAVSAYYLDDTAIMDTIQNCTDIMDFCATQKSNKKYQLELNNVINGKAVVTNLSKNIRFYVSKGNTKLQSGLILKNDTSVEEGGLKKRTNIVSGRNVTIFNKKVTFNDMKDYCIDYGYYYTEAKKIVQAIESRSTKQRVIKKQYGQYKLGL